MISGEVSRHLSIIQSGVQFQNKITLKGIILDTIIPFIKYFFQNTCYMKAIPRMYVCMYVCMYISGK